MTFRGALSRSGEIYREFLGRFLIALVVLLAGLNLAVALVAQTGGGHRTLRAILLYFAILVGTAWGQATMVEDIHDRRAGKGDASIAELYGRTWRLAPRVAWATFWQGVLVAVVFFVCLFVAFILATLGLTGFLIGLALAGLVALYLYSRWILIVPVIVIEREGVGWAFSRSSGLVGRHTWKVMALVALALVVAGAVDVALGTLIDRGLNGWLERWLSGIVNGVVFSSALVAVSTALYYELAGERPDPGQLGTAPIELIPSWADEDLGRIGR